METMIEAVMDVFKTKYSECCSKTYDTSLSLDVAELMRVVCITHWPLQAWLLELHETRDALWEAFRFKYESGNTRTAPYNKIQN